MRAPHLIYSAVGKPAISGMPGICRACGSEGIGELFEDWVRPTFTDWDKLFPGEILCHACLFCFADANGELARIVGKDKPQRMRNYSHFIADGEWIPLSKGKKNRMLELLPRSEAAVIALSGQKHLAFRCPLGWWQIEEHTVRPFPLELMRDLAICGELYDGGISKTEIETGRYDSKRIAAFGFARWRELESTVKSLRGSLRLQLSLFLVQKQEEEDGDRGD